MRQGDRDEFERIFRSERLVVLAAHGPDATAAERAELATMVETLRFVDAPTS